MIGTSVKLPLSGIVIYIDNCIFTSVFHRILDFKNGAGFLSWPLFLFNIESLLSSVPDETVRITIKNPSEDSNDLLERCEKSSHQRSKYNSLEGAPVYPPLKLNG